MFLILPIFVFGLLFLIYTSEQMSNAHFRMFFCDLKNVIRCWLCFAKRNEHFYFLPFTYNVATCFVNVSMMLSLSC